jgi:hypothetical protein
MKMRALNVPILTREVADRLEALLNDRPGVEVLKIGLESHELYIAFNERILDLRTLAGLMAEAGCPLRSIRAVVVQ